MKKSVKIILICIAAFLVVAGVLVIVSRRVPKGDISALGYSCFNGKKESVVSHKEYFLDEDGRIIKMITVGDEGVSSITENEYDSLGRLSLKKYWQKGYLSFDDSTGTETYTYYKDSDMITDHVEKSPYITGDNEHTEKEVKEHMEYDAEGRLVSKEETENILNYRSQSIYKKYDPNGIVIYSEYSEINENTPGETPNDGKPMIITEYDADNKIIRNYYYETAVMGQPYDFQTHASLRTLASEIKLTDEGKYDTVKDYFFEEDEKGEIQTSFWTVTYYNYTPDDINAGYETTTYDSEGEPMSWELFDKQGRAIKWIEYYWGEEYKHETDYNAIDPELPGEQVIHTTSYKKDENGDMVLYSEIWEKKISYGILEESEDADENGFEIYRSSYSFEGAMRPDREYSFYDNGFIKEKHVYAYYDGSTGYNKDKIIETIYEYDDHGNCIKQWKAEKGKEKILEYVWEYTYRD